VLTLTAADSIFVIQLLTVKDLLTLTAADSIFVIQLLTAKDLNLVLAI
jgi:hypothetical protein